MQMYHRAVCLLILALSCAASIALGKDGNWDLLNYHFYNPYMLLTGRLYTDFLPAQTQTYLNPLMDIPTYLMITGFKPVVVGAVMGVFHGLNLVLVYLLALRVFKSLPERILALVAAAVTVLGAGGSIVRGLFGTFMGDLTMSILVLAALYALLRADGGSGRRRTWWIFWAGLLIGVGTGLKATALFHAIPLVGLSIFVGARATERVRLFLICAAAFCAGFLLTYGYWAVLLQQRFESPFFPYYNAIFQSPYAIARNLTDFLHWMPTSLRGHLALPFTFLLPDGGLGQAEVYFREWRPGIAFIALVVLAAMLVWRLSRRGIARFDWTRAKPTLMLSVFFLMSWVIWQAEFSYYRYLAALELIAPLMVAAIAYLIVPRVAALGLMVLAMFVLLIPTTVPLDYGRQPWSDEYFGVRIPPTLQLADSQVYIADLDRPLGYVIPYFPASTQVLRLVSNMNSMLFSGDARGGLIDELSNEIRKPGRKYVMFVNEIYTTDATLDDVNARIRGTLGQYGLAMRSGNCEEIETAFHVVTLCEIGLTTE